MCYGEEKSKLEWTKQTPTETGDYLWVEQWECGCVIKSGIAFIVDGEISWEGQEPNFYGGEPSINFWAKIQLPNPEED